MINLGDKACQHSLDFLHRSLAKLVIDRGQVVAEGSAQELKALVGAETLDDVFLTLTDTDRPALGELGPSRR